MAEPLSPDAVAAHLASLEDRLTGALAQLEDLHKRFRPVEAFVAQGWPLHLERIDDQGRKLDAMDARWQAVDREIVRIRTQLTIAAAGLMILIPILTTLLQRLLGLGK